MTPTHGPSPSQTVGPFPHESWRWAFTPPEVAAAAPIVVAGRVYDGNGAVVTDAVVEAWSTAGTDRSSGLAGFQRVACDVTGGYVLAVAGQPRAGEPAVLVTVFARGLLCHQFTAVWLADDPTLAEAPALARVPPARRGTLLAQPAHAAGGRRYAWDLHLQGNQETVFFDYR